MWKRKKIPRFFFWERNAGELSIVFQIMDGKGSVLVPMVVRGL